MAAGVGQQWVLVEMVQAFYEVRPGARAWRAVRAAARGGVGRGGAGGACAEGNPPPSRVRADGGPGRPVAVGPWVAGVRAPLSLGRWCGSQGAGRRWGWRGALAAPGRERAVDQCRLCKTALAKL